MSDGELAVVVDDLHKGYGETPVLQGLSMNVPAGTIYGLLGASGCGKSTLMKILVGRLSYKQGVVHVFGRAPGSAGHAVPGSLIGYMPQEIALFNDLTINETLTFYGKLAGMQPQDLNARIRFLLHFLRLPEGTRLVQQLSGGQQRRVSLCVALLHRPRLLILDEPTVGVDPLLRHKIWQYLLEISQTGTTIIITTHYIEEARQAHRVGLMRNGRLLAEGAPLSLMDKFREDNLEAVFLRLCQQNHQLLDPDTDTPMMATGGTTSRSRDTSQEDDFWLQQNSGSAPPSPPSPLSPYRTSSTSSTSSASSIRSLLSADAKFSTRSSSRPPLEHGSPPTPFCGGRPRWSNTYALLWRNWKILSRNVPFLVFQFLLPALQVLLFCLAIGDTPQHLPIAIVNMDNGVNVPVPGGPAPSLPPSLSTRPLASLFPASLLPASLGGTDLSHQSPRMYYLSQRILGALDNQAIRQIKYTSEAEALDAVKHGQVNGYLLFSAQFSQYLLLRCQTGNVTDAMINEGSVVMNLDMTNQELSVTIQTQIAAAFLTGMTSLLAELQALGVPVSSSALQSFVRVQTPPIYGTANPKFTDFIAPGMIVAIAFAQSIGLTCIAIVMAKKEGTLDRQWSAGVKPSEMMGAQCVTQFILLLVQVWLLLCVALYIFKLPLHGNLLLVMVLTQILGMCGMLYGLFLSSICNNEEEAVNISNGSFFPVMLLSGIIWPVQAIPTVLRYVAQVMPTTWAADALRDILARGWGLDRTEVWQAFLVLIGWCLFFLMLSARGLKHHD